MAGSASPRKPNVETPTRSEASLILDVPCRASARGTSSADMPAPSSLTRTSLRPPSSTAISIADAPASIEFSTSSFTTEEGRSTTSPAAIWSATALGRIEIKDMLIPKLPILPSRWGGDVLFLPLSLNVRLLVLGGVENRLRLLWRHPGYRLWSGRLISALCRRRARVRALPPAASATATPATSSPAFSLTKSELVVPSCIRIRDHHLEYLLVAKQGAVEWCVGRILCSTTLQEVIEPQIESRVMSDFGVF